MGAGYTGVFPSVFRTVTRLGSPTTETEVPAPKTSMVSPLPLPSIVTVSAGRRRCPTDRPLEVDDDLGRVSAREVVDRDCDRRRQRRRWLIASTSFRSIVMLATSRVNRTRPPFAEMSMVSAMFAPKKSQRVGVRPDPQPCPSRRRAPTSKCFRRRAAPCRCRARRSRGRRRRRQGADGRRRRR